MCRNLMLLDSKNFGEKGRPPCAQVSRNAWEDIRRMTKKMAHNREKMRAKLNVLKFILVLYRLDWAKKVSLAAICLVAGSASFGLREN